MLFGPKYIFFMLLFTFNNSPIYLPSSEYILFLVKFIVCMLLFKNKFYIKYFTTTLHNSVLHNFNSVIFFIILILFAYMIHQ